MENNKIHIEEKGKAFNPYQLITIMLKTFTGLTPDYILWNMSWSLCSSLLIENIELVKEKNSQMNRESKKSGKSELDGFRGINGIEIIER